MINLKVGDYIHDIIREPIDNDTTKYIFSQYLVLNINNECHGLPIVILTHCGRDPDDWDNIYFMDDLRDNYTFKIKETTTSGDLFSTKWSWDDGCVEIQKDIVQGIGSFKYLIKNYKNRKERIDKAIDLRPGDYLKKICTRKSKVPDKLKALLADFLESDITEISIFEFLILDVRYDSGWPTVIAAPIIHPVGFWQRCFNFDDAIISNTIVIHPEAESHAILKQNLDASPFERRFVKIAYQWGWDGGTAVLPYLEENYPDVYNRKIVNVTIYKNLIDDFLSGASPEKMIISEEDSNCSARKHYMNNIQIHNLNN